MRRSSTLAVLLLILSAFLPLTAASAADVGIAITDALVFDPEIAGVEVDDVVTWTNTGEFEPHNIISEDGRFESEVLQPGDTFTYEITPDDDDQAIRYICTIHPGMEGQLLVGDAEPVADFFPPTEDGSFVRLDADDAVGASVAWSAEYYETGTVPIALLARDDLFADSLSSSGLQGALGAPLLLTPPNAEDERVAGELERLGVEEVVILGGEATGVQDYGYPSERLAGGARIETAIEIARDTYPDAETAMVVRAYGDDGPDDTRAFIDSLGAGAYAARQGIPVFLSEPEQLADAVGTYMGAAESLTTVIVVGGTDALDEQVVTDLEGLGKEVIRIGGANRFATAAMLALDLGQPAAAMYVDGVNDLAWASGFSAASVAARGGALVLTSGDSVPPETAALAAAGGVPYSVCGPFVEDVACDSLEAITNQIASAFVGDFVSFPEGRKVVPGPGAEGGMGDSQLFVLDDGQTICYQVFTYSAEDNEITAMAIAEGAESATATPVIDLPAPINLNGDPTSTFYPGCAFDVDSDLVDDLQANPTDYALVADTASQPGGAFRDQLRVPLAVAFAEASGDQVVPGPGDGTAGGFTNVVLTEDVICQFAIVVDDIEGLFSGEAPPTPLDPSATAANIHEGMEGETGTVVQALRAPTTVEIGYCTDYQDGFDTEAFTEDPSSFYYDVSNSEFPDGAVRGQFFNPFAEGPPPPGEAKTAPQPTRLPRWSWGS